MTSRSMLIKRLRCIACTIEGVDQPNPTEAHHCNEGGHAGQKRRGDDAQLPLCGWHHRAVRPVGMSCDAMTHIYGPSLALDSKQFRFAYGQDDVLLIPVNRDVAQLLPETA